MLRICSAIAVGVTLACAYVLYAMSYDTRKLELSVQASEGQAERLRSDRAATVAEVDPGDIDRYDSMRRQFGGVAVAPLNGRMCGGCHLDLSAVELDAVRAAPPDEMPECPQCGRLLVR